MAQTNQAITNTHKHLYPKKIGPSLDPKFCKYKATTRQPIDSASSPTLHSSNPLANSNSFPLFPSNEAHLYCPDHFDLGRFRARHNHFHELRSRSNCHDGYRLHCDP